jgi:protein involved in polysaccharide export with SLBB domain
MTTATMKSKLVWWLVLFSTTALALLAQESGKDSVLLRAPKIDRKIRPDDQLLISVYGHAELPKSVRVESDGSIKYPFMKDVKVDGLTSEQMANVLSARLSQYIGVRTEVVVSFSEEELIEVIVLGQVNSPGSHRMPRNNTIQGAISMAGGTTKQCDYNKTKLIRKNPETGLREEFTLALESIIIETGDIEKLPQLKDGDIVFVPAIYGAVYANVLGAVRSPGNFPIFPGATVVDLIFLAGGPQDDASIRNIKLVHRVGAAMTEKFVDLEAVLKAKGGVVPLVEPGDIIFVPTKKFTFKTVVTVLQFVVPLLTLYVLMRNAKII